MLHVDLPTESRGGVAQQVSRLSDELVARGHEATVFTFSPPPAGARYDVHRLPLRGALARRPLNLLTAPVAFALGRYGSFDVVHAHGDSELLVRRRPPVVRTFYGSARDEARTAGRARRRIAQRLLYRGELLARRTAAFTVGISRATEEAIGPLDSLVPCGVDLRRFHPSEKSPRPSILFVGTLEGRKRGRFLLDAFRDEIRPRLPECELWLVADGDARGPGVRAFQRPDNEALAALFRRAWVFASPSLYEGFGVPYIEAMASGTAVVATPNPGSLELLTAESGGVLVCDELMGSTLLELLRDDERRRRLAQLGTRYSARFAWSEVTAAYEEIYEALSHRSDVGRTRIRG